MSNLDLNLLLLSNSTLPNQEYLEFAQPIIKDFLRELSTGLFIPFAAVGFTYEDYTDKVNHAFANVGLSVENIAKIEDKTAAVENANYIVIGGGNTFRLLERIYHFEIVEAIKNKVNSGTPYIGWSAGANLASPGIYTSNDMPIIMPPSFAALHFVDFQINPHYNNAQPEGHKGETRDQRIKEYLALNPKNQVYGIPEGTYIRLNKGLMKFDGIKDGMKFLFKKDEVLRRGILN